MNDTVTAMRIWFRALAIPLVLSSCYGGVVDDGGDELGSSVTDSSDGNTEGDGDTTTEDGDVDADADTSTDTDTGTSTTDDADADVDVDAETDTDTDTSTTGGVEGCSADAIELIDLVNAYRADNGLPAIPASPSLCTVATTHVQDLFANGPHLQPGGCNLHSWSDQGPWSPCCYTPDHAQAQCMWDKPTELTVYPGYGYENAASGVASPAQALQLWQSSVPHNEVILNLGIWANHPWQAIGADVYQGYSVLWFGEQVDPG
jgi:uncharacterized protein YkwD